MNHAQNSKPGWREEARRRATKEADGQELKGQEREAFIGKREAEIYDEFVQRGFGNMDF